MINALPLLLGDDGYQISRSVRLRSSASAYFSRTPGSASNRTTWTWSGWLKRGAIGTGPYVLLGANNSPSSDALYFSNDALTFAYYTGTTTVVRQTTAVYRDPSSWYHIVVVADTTNATAQNRMRFYINGSEVTAWSTNLTITQNQQYVINAAVAHNLGCNIGPQQYTDGYLTEINFIDGQALTPSAFGETDAITGVWKPKKYGGTYGTNGFYLNFSDNSAATAAAIGKDYSGNGNNWTPNNISVTAGSTYDSMIDTPTAYADGNSGRGNYAVLNPLRYSTNGSLSEANLKYSNGSGDNGAKAIATIGIPSGKWYWEGSWISGPSNSRFIVGFASSSTAVTSVSMPFERDGSNLSLAANDIANVAIDFDAGKIWYGKNGVWQASGDPATGANPMQTFTPSSYDFLYPGIRLYGASDGTTVGVVNFGQRPFAYTPPTGFKALHTGNLPEPTIKKGNQYFDATVWQGNSSTQNIVNSGAMQPDLVWVKDRSTVNIENHWLADSVRGATKHLSSNLTDAEYTFSTAITGFNSNGFAVGADGKVNRSADSYIGWQWKEGATPGFDIVTYTGNATAGRTVAHSLGVAPRMMIVKRRDFGDDWRVYHASLGATKYIDLNLTNAAATATTVWNNTEPTSSVFSVGTSNSVNGSSATYVAYLFSEVAGFSKFGSYTGNGSADGPFVFCGFRPKFVMVKRTDSANWWVIWDSARNTYNPVSNYLQAESSNSENNSGASATNYLDDLSNGFKLRDSALAWNANGGTYIYAAFAETPFRYALAR